MFHTTAERLFPAIALSVTATIALACAGGDAGESVLSPRETAAVTFMIDSGSGTKVTGASAEEEDTVNRWSLLVFGESDGALYETSTSSGPGALTASLGEGSYTVAAVVNHPASGAGALIPDEVESLQELRAFVMPLGACRTGNLVMYGEASLTVSRDGVTPPTLEIPVGRLVAKVEVGRIEMDMIDTALADRTFTINGIYLINLPSSLPLGSDWTVASIPEGAGNWLNCEAFTGGDSASLTGDTGIGAPLSASSPYSTTHTFYILPNPIPEGADSYGGSWSPRRSRLVLEVEVDGETFFYPFSLPPQSRNSVYLAEKITLRHKGIDTPDGEVGDRADIVFTCPISQWSPTYTVNDSF